MACMQGGHPCQAVLTDRLWEPRCLHPADTEEKERSGVIWQVETWYSKEALGELAVRIGQRKGVKEGLMQTSFSCLIERLCNEGEVRNPDTEKFRKSKIDRSSLFAFGSQQLIKA